MKVVFIAPFPPELFKSKLTLRDESTLSHPCSWVRALSQELVRSCGIELHVITTSPNVVGDTSFNVDGITYYFIDSSLPRIVTKMLGLHYTASLGMKPLVKIWRCLRQIEPDIVHGHGTESYYSLAAVYSGYKAVVSVQGIMAHVFLAEKSARSRVVRHFERHTIRKAQYINVKNEVSREFVEAVNPGARVFFIEPAINGIFWSRPLPQLSHRLFFAGALVKRKGIEEFIEVIARVRRAIPDLEAVVFGDGASDYIARLKEFAASLGVGDKVHFFGQVDFSRMVEMYGKGGVFCLSSYVETTSNATVEAMAAGLPVVATNVGSVARIVEHGKTGVIVERGAIDAMASAAISILTNESLYYAYGKAGRESLSGHWNSLSVAKKHVEMYRVILEGERNPRSSVPAR